MQIKATIKQGYYIWSHKYVATKRAKMPNELNCFIKLKIPIKKITEIVKAAVKTSMEARNN